jgi:hypothetical protein
LFWDCGYPDVYARLFGLYDYGALSGYVGYLPGHPRPASRSGSTSASETQASLAEMCGSSNRDMAGLPIERFRDAIQPNNEQGAALDDLANASAKAAEAIRNSCPADVTLTAPSRLAAMEQRLDAMHNAVTIVQPALEKVLRPPDGRAEGQDNGDGGLRRWTDAEHEPACALRWQHAILR